jgi:wyosine [tRNA(Phe)-imidazoG37] synthetase (radical SAM superfamily)
MVEEKKYLFGPVPSRRLGLSLGVDIVPFKTCTLDCVYCQLGKTTEKTIERRQYVPAEPVLAELKVKLAEGLTADYITISGSGEPTLNSRLGELIAGIKKITDIPVAILTNGTLLYREDVRADCAGADVVLPSLDAGDQQVFEKLNRPHADISIAKLIDGLAAFRREFSGAIWLEVFLIEGLNTDAEQIAKIKNAIARIRPDKVQLNTAVRPTTDTDVKGLKFERLKTIAGQIGQNCEVVTDFSPRCSSERNVTRADGEHQVIINHKAETLLSMLKRRPCSLDDICSGLGLHQNEALKYIGHLQSSRLIDSEKRDGLIFFKTIKDP